MGLVLKCLCLIPSVHLPVLSGTCVFLLLDESFAVSHWKRGTLGMANKGPHSNGSQFYITLQPAPWMDRTYVAFGSVSLICLIVQFCINLELSYSFIQT